MGALICIAIGILAAITLSTTFTIEEDFKLSYEREHKLELVNEIEAADLELTLAAMEAIVKKDEKKINDEVMSAIEESSEF